jgi:hypothetical protein
MTEKIMQIMAPDEVFTAAEAAVHLRRKTRQVQRYLERGLLAGTRPAGRWQTTALAIWRFQGIEQEMIDLWLKHCASRNVGEE